jgi:TonB-dependent SusC/RagA subfamily outer membrane receptor
MSRYPPCVPLSCGIVVGLTLACAPGANPPPRLSPTTMVSSREAAISLDQMLAGRIAGVCVARVPGGGISVLIRGPASFYLSNEPLYVVDGVPVEAGPQGALSWLRPEDIASIAVLKDADAVIFGARGANGVVVIKTKGTR